MLLLVLTKFQNAEDRLLVLGLTKFLNIIILRQCLRDLTKKLNMFLSLAGDTN
jgi:hypothetical protein